MNTLLLFLVLMAHQDSKPYLIQTQTPFTPNGIITLARGSFCDSLAAIPKERQSERVRIALKKCATDSPDKIESGVMNGVAYRFYYTDGSGLFEGEKEGGLTPLSAWSVGCEKDEITDEKSCYMDKGDVRIWIDNRRRSELYIGSQHYPGSQVVIRIDKGTPLAIAARTFNGSFGYRASPSIINRISRARTVTTRYQEWPYRDYKDETWDVYGFNEALAYINWAVAHAK